MDIGLLHPGEMGAAVGSALVGASQTVRWASEHRSPATVARATSAGLIDVTDLAGVVSSSAIVLSICPPHGAVELAAQTFAAATSEHWTGVYVDANAIAPSTVARVAAMAEGTGIAVVDGAIIGPPPTKPGVTRLYLSGSEAGVVADCCAGSLLEAIVMSERVGDASALKLSFAAWSKGSQALLLTARAAAEAAGVGPWLNAEWEHSMPELASMLDRSATAAATKGWRWSGEMQEVAAFLDHCGLPDGFHRAAGEVFARVPRREAEGGVPDLLDLLADLRRPQR